MLVPVDSEYPYPTPCWGRGLATPAKVPALSCSTMGHRRVTGGSEGDRPQ